MPLFRPRTRTPQWKRCADAVNVAGLLFTSDGTITVGNYSFDRTCTFENVRVGDAVVNGGGREPVTVHRAGKWYALIYRDGSWWHRV